MLKIEALEDRRCLTVSVSFANGTLDIQDAGGPAEILSISVFTEGGVPKFQVVNRGDTFETIFDAADLQWITMQLGSGDDTVMLGAVTEANGFSNVQTSSYLGAGLDNFGGSPFPDYVFGEADTDLISTGAGNDTLNGDGRNRPPAQVLAARFAQDSACSHHML